MSYVEQEDVFQAVEPVIKEVLKNIQTKALMRFSKITYKDSMLKYGNDKPDLRFALEIQDVTDIFRNSGFTIFAKSIENGSVVRAVPGPNCGSRSVADRMNSWAQGEGRLEWDILFLVKTLLKDQLQMHWELKNLLK